MKTRVMPRNMPIRYKRIPRITADTRDRASEFGCRNCCKVTCRIVTTLYRMIIKDNTKGTSLLYSEDSRCDQTCRTRKMRVAHSIGIGITIQIHLQDEFPGGFVILFRAYVIKPCCLFLLKIGYIFLVA